MNAEVRMKNAEAAAGRHGPVAGRVPISTAFGLLLIVAAGLMLAGCIGPDITDPDWQSRDAYNHLPPTSPAPPRQWDPNSISIFN